MDEYTSLKDQQPEPAEVPGLGAPVVPFASAADEVARTEFLAPLRKQIDALDERIIALLNERAGVVVEIGKAKQATDTPIYVPERERQVFERINRHNKGPLPASCVQAVFRELMSGSFALERPLRVGFLGPKGSFTHLAATKKFGSSIEYDAMSSIHSVFEEVSRGHVDMAVVPIENSTEGAVHDSLDCFLEFPAVRVRAELIIGVHHQLVANVPLESITRLLSHPQAFGQCRRFLDAQMPDVPRVPTASTSQAAMLAAQQAAAGEPGAAAICSVLAGQLYGMKTQFTNIEDNSSNCTRFFVITNKEMLSKPSGADKTSLMFSTGHEPGALSNVLGLFAGVNLTHIEKRPSRRSNFNYVFFIDVEGHRDDPSVQAAIEAASARALDLRVLGSFPKADLIL